jgi:hypothetical protein
MVKYNKMGYKEIGSSKLSEILPHLKQIAALYGLRLYRANEFKHARIILANLYNRELI